MKNLCKTLLTFLVCISMTDLYAIKSRSASHDSSTGSTNHNSLRNKISQCLNQFDLLDSNKFYCNEDTGIINIEINEYDKDNAAKPLQLTNATSNIMETILTHYDIGASGEQDIDTPMLKKYLQKYYGHKTRGAIIIQIIHDKELDSKNFLEKTTTLSSKYTRSTSVNNIPCQIEIEAVSGKYKFSWKLLSKTDTPKMYIKLTIGK